MQEQVADGARHGSIDASGGGDPIQATRFRHLNTGEARTLTKVHVERLVELRHHLDSAVKEVHLVDEQVAENARAVDHDVNARAAELLQWDDLELVDAAKSISHGANTDHPKDLRDSPG